MSPDQIRIVRTTFAALSRASDDTAAMFYSRLFEIEPALRALFRGDLHEQGRKLMQVIAVAVSSLDRLDSLVPTLRDLGRRHAGYGVADRHYDIVAAALLWTIERRLGDAYTAEVRGAWTTAYQILANTMKAGACVGDVRRYGARSRDSTQSAGADARNEVV